MNLFIEPMLQPDNVFTFLLFFFLGGKEESCFCISVVFLGGKEEETRRQTELRLTSVAGWW